MTPMRIAYLEDDHSFYCLIKRLRHWRVLSNTKMFPEQNSKSEYVFGFLIGCFVVNFINLVTLHDMC